MILLWLEHTYYLIVSHWLGLILRWVWLGVFAFFFPHSQIVIFKWLSVRKIIIRVSVTAQVIEHAVVLVLFGNLVKSALHTLLGLFQDFQVLAWCLVKIKFFCKISQPFRDGLLVFFPVLAEKSLLFCKISLQFLGVLLGFIPVLFRESHLFL